MADVNNQNIPNPMPNPVSEPQPSLTSEPAAASMPPSAGGKNKMVILFSGVLAVAVFLLAVAGYFYYKNSTASYTSNNQTATQAYVTPAPSITPSPTPLSAVQSSSDLSNVLNELNNSSDKDLQSDFTQANSEGSNL